jgi:uncharacterized protein (TIGR03067 family)
VKKPSKPRPSRPVEQLRTLEGQWACESLEMDGASMPVPPFPSAQLLIDGDRFRMMSPEAIHEGIFNIDVEENPSQIDIEFVEGPETGQWSYGIYALDGDELTICLGLTGAPRPTRFATSRDSGHALQRFHRVSGTRPANVTGGKRATSAAAVAAPSPPVDESVFTHTSTPLLEKLQGEWLPVSLTTNGAPLQNAFLAYGSRTQTGNETRVVFGGQTMVHALMRLDESVAPVAIDYLNIGKGPRVVSRGILDWVGADIRVCMAKAGDPRPEEFSSDPGSGRILSVWRRAKARTKRAPAP